LHMGRSDIAEFVELLQPFNQLIPERICHLSSPFPRYAPGGESQDWRQRAHFAPVGMKSPSTGFGLQPHQSTDRVGSLCDKPPQPTGPEAARFPSSAPHANQPG
jgi:hypothetical protein